MINNRQAGRRRGRGGNPNGQRQGSNPGRPDNGNRIDSRARGNASQLHEKYRNLASDAQRQGDRVNTEYYLQFADHYFRVLSEQRGRFEEQPPRRARDDFDFDGEDDYGDEGEPVRPGEQAGDVPRVDARADYRDERPRDGQRRDGQQREGGDQPRPYRDQPQGRDGQDQQRQQRDASDQPRQSREEADRPRATRDDREAQRTPRDAGDQPRDDGYREPRRPREQAPRPVEIAGQRRADPPVAGEALEGRAEAVLEADAPLDAPAAPRRRGRPRREAAEAPAAPLALEADRLPPSLSSTAAPANDGEPVEDDEVRPRRRRVRVPAIESPAAE